MRKFNDYLVQSLKDPSEAEMYINTALELYAEDGNWQAFLLALKAVAQARGGIGKLANNSGINREHLYVMLSPEGNPRIDTLGIILREFGLRLTVKAISS
jgi:probable addiction module antidote protein